MLLFLVSFFSFSQNQITILKKELKKEEDSIKLLIKIANHYIEKEKNSDSIFKYSHILKDIAKRESDSLLFGETYRQFAHAHYLSSTYDSVFYFGEKSIKLFKKLEKTDKKANTEILLGNTHRLLFNNKEALRFFKNALPNAKNKDQIAVQIGLATVQIQLNNLEQASFRYNEAFRISKELDNDVFLYNIHNGLATVYLKSGKSNEVLVSLEKALEIAENQENYIGQIKCLHNIGHYYNGVEKYKEAVIVFKKAIILLPKTNSEYAKASVYRLYAESLAALNDVESANFYLDKAEKIYEERLPTRLGQIKLARANLAIHNQNTIKAIALLNEGISISKENKIMGNIEACYRKLFEIQENTGDSKAALEAYKKYKIYGDSVAQRNKTKEIETLKVQFDIAQYEQDILVKDQKLALFDSQKKNSQYRNILLGFVLIGLIFFIYRQRKINSINKTTLIVEKELNSLKQAQILQGKKEITEYAIHINEHNKLLDNLLTQIKSVKRKAIESAVKSGLTNLQIYIKDNMDINKEKIALDTKVGTEQQDFIFKLKQKFPNLSQKEIQVATYLVLNLTSKQVANQMQIKEQSIYNYRLSLRKKMGIDKKDNLNESLRSLN